MATGGSPFNIERFAYDIFKFNWLRFYKDIAIAEPRNSKNSYELPDFIYVFATVSLSHQLSCRDVWREEFVIEFNSNKLEEFHHVSGLLKKFFEKLLVEPYFQRPFTRALISIAVINELIQFLYSQNRNLFVNDLARFWSEYFAGFRKEFEKEGGFSVCYEQNNYKFQSLDGFIEKFISKHCIPYRNLGNKVKKWNQQVKLLVLKNASDTKDECDQSALDSHFRKKLTISSKSTGKVKSENTQVSDSLANPGLGIPRHEELIQDCYSPSVVGDAFSVKSDTESCAEGTSGAEIPRPEGKSKDRGDLAVSPLSPGRQSKGRGRLVGSPLSAERQTKGRGGLTGTSLGTEGQSTGRGSLFGSPAIPEEKTRRDSPRTPKGNSRLEQKRQKHLRSERTEPSD